MVVIGSTTTLGDSRPESMAGTIAVLESAGFRAGEAGKRRQLFFAAWGAEVRDHRSVEWVEAGNGGKERRCIHQRLDMAAMGPEFGASASPSRSGADRAAAKRAAGVGRTGGDHRTWTWMPDGANPGGRGSATSAAGRTMWGSCAPQVPSAGFGGRVAGTAWHTTRDTLVWYWKVVGADYEPALMISRMTNLVAARLANDPVLPLDLVRPSADALDWLKTLDQRGLSAPFLTPAASAGEPRTSVELAALTNVVRSHSGRAAELATRIDRLAAAGRLDSMARIA